MRQLDWNGSPQERKKESKSVNTREGEQREVRDELDAGEGRREEQTQVLSCSRDVLEKEVNNRGTGAIKTFTTSLAAVRSA